MSNVDWEEKNPGDGNRSIQWVDQSPVGPSGVEWKEARKSRRAGYVVAAVAAAVLGVAIHQWIPDGEKPVIIVTKKDEPPVKPPVEKQRVLADTSSCKEAMRLAEAAPATTSAQTEARDQEIRWVRYLEEIQALGAHDNWAGKPCDLYVENRDRRPARDLVVANLAVIQASGINLQYVSVRVSITSSGATTIVVPAGTLFASPSANTQSMMSAAAATFAFAAVLPSDNMNSAFDTFRRRVALLHPGQLLSSAHAADPAESQLAMVRRSGSPRIMQQKVAAYCVNRWRDVPGSSTTFSVSLDEQSTPLRKLVTCLAGRSEGPSVRQRAVWLISDNLLGMTPNQLEERIVQYKDGTFPRTSAGFADYAKKINPEISDDKLAAIRSIPQGDFEQVRPLLLRDLAQLEIKEYAEQSRPLLQACGIDVSSSALFR